MMKRRLLLLPMLLLCLLLTGCRASEEISISRAPLAPAPEGSLVIPLDGATLSIALGTDFVCLQQGDRPFRFAELGLDAEYAKSAMRENGILALIFDVDGDIEIQLTAAPVDHESFDDMTGYHEARLVAEARGSYQDSGYELLGCGLVRETGHKFVRTLVSWRYADGYQEQSANYHTIQARQYVRLSVFPPAGEELTEAQLTQLDALVDTIRIY